jgi:hypothetical protein
MSITAVSDAIDLSPSGPSLSSLDVINFFLAGMQAGFGPFVAVLLADEKWTQQNIGYVRCWFAIWQRASQRALLPDQFRLPADIAISKISDLLNCDLGTFLKKW